MSTTDKYLKAIALFDEANTKDPNKVNFEGKSYPKELLYAIRMTNKLEEFESNASEALKLTARCQHICRWEIPREQYEMNRSGYLNWRKDLKSFHADKAKSILKEVGYDDAMLNDVAFLLLKKQLKRNADTQTLEDVICLVFLEYYFDDFSEKYKEDKLVDILQKTWAKMSDRGKEFALQLKLSDRSVQLIQKALA